MSWENYRWFVGGMLVATGVFMLDAMQRANVQEAYAVGIARGEARAREDARLDAELAATAAAAENPQ